MRDDVVEVPESDYKVDIARYIEMASGDKMVSVIGKDGKPVLILGRGKPVPRTAEDVAADEAFLEELRNLPAPLPGEKLNSWLD